MEKVSPLNGFVEFIREQGVIGLAVGFMLGGAVSKVVTALVTDLVNPLIGMALGSASGLKDASYKIGTAEIMYGDFIGVCIDFLVIALLVYTFVRIFRLDKLQKGKG